MAPEVRRLVAGSFRPVAYPFGGVVVREGDAADAFYVIASGTARAIKNADDGEEVPLGVLGPGDSFGELALVEDTTRTATVRASSELVVLRLDRSIFQALLDTDPRIRTSLDLHVKRLHLQEFFRLYTAFSRLSSGALQLLLREAEPVVAQRGEVLVRQGARTGPMYVVRDGHLRAYRTEKGKRRSLAFLRRGDFFGEVSMIRATSREATVEAVSRSELLRIGRKTFDKLMKREPEFRRQLEDRISQYEYRRVARVPLDFAEEILPADLGCPTPDAVHPETAAAITSEEEAAEELGAGNAAERAKITRFPFVRQIDEMDCGAACLAMITRHFGRAVALGFVRESVQPGIDGTSLLGLVRGGEAVGMDARAVKASKSRLDALPLPAVVHWEGNHWIVVYDVDDRRVRVADPARGNHTMRREEFAEKWTGFAVLFEPTPRLAEAPVGLPGVRWVWGYLRPYLPTFVKASVLAILAAGLNMLFPIFTQIVVDRVIGMGKTGTLNLVLFGMLGALGVMLVASIGQRYLLAKAAVGIDGTALDAITGRLLALPMSYFHSRRTGDLIRRLSGLRQAREFFVTQGVIGITALAQLVAALGLMFFYSWRLALVFLAVSPAYAALMRFSAKRLRPMFDGLEESFGTYQSRQVDAIRGIETVKALGADDIVRRRITAEFSALARRIFRADFTLMLYGGAVELATFLSLALFLWMGARQVLAHRLSIGGLVSFNALVLLANAPLTQLLSLWDELQISSVLLHRLNDVFEQEPEQGFDHSRLTRVPTLEGRVACVDVEFRYPGGGPPVLEHVSFDVKPGTTVAIVGRSGSGKTTLAKCLAGLYEPTAGTVAYDAVDIKTLDYRELRRQIGFVLQDNYLFDDTISRNIALGDDAPDVERVMRAARAAEAATFVERFPFGYDTKVGEGGVLLSGGQRQRIAIARALYAAPAVLILDEATSSLDVEAERAVQENLAGLAGGRTTFVIAHRLSTVRDADLILVLERGRIVETGRHDDLMAKRGIYYYLCSQQLEL